MPHTATLKPKEDRRLLRGHRWAYRNEFAALPNAEDGDLVDVLADGGRFLGRGFFQTTGCIASRAYGIAFLMTAVDTPSRLLLPRPLRYGLSKPYGRGVVMNRLQMVPTAVRRKEMP